MPTKRLPLLLLILLAALALAACGNTPPPPTPTPPPPTPTNTPLPTHTPTPTNTPTPTPTATFTPTPSPTPDLRVILANPQEFLCQKSDLPAKGHYILPNSSWISPHHNYEIIQSWGKEKGQKYLDETKRVDGWWAAYYRSSNNAALPQYIFCNPVQYETIEGAHISFSQYNEIAEHKPGYTEVPNPPQIGDETILMRYSGVDQNGQPEIALLLEYRYRNYVIRIEGDGTTEEEAKLSAILPVAQSILQRLQQAELSPPPTP